MDEWDWNGIEVVNGEWWLLVIGLLLLLGGMAIGYILGRQAERKYWERRTPPIPPTDGSSRIDPSAY